MCAPMTVLQTSKWNSTSHHTRDDISTGTRVIAAMILGCKLWIDSTLLLRMMSWIYPQKKSIGFKSGLCGGQLIGPPLPIHQPGNCPQQSTQWHKNGLVHHLVGKWCHQLQLLSVGTQSSLYHIHINCTRGGALMEEAESNNSVWHDAPSYIDLGAVTNMLL
jgi:hypothetical protein